jgi:hypothetical protein
MVNNMYMFNVLDHERKRQNEREFVLYLGYFRHLAKNLVLSDLVTRLLRQQVIKCPLMSPQITASFQMSPTSGLCY